MKKIAIVGRTNVGKSTLFNRLTGKKDAIVHDMPGVTRDRREGVAHIGDIDFIAIDTAGLEETGDLSRAMWVQTQKAIDEADIVLMVVDSRGELNPLDTRLAAELRQLNKPVLLLANKCEGNAQFLAATEAYKLGIGDPIAVSGAHGQGMMEIFQALLPYFPNDVEEEEVIAEEFDEKELKIAIVGRPNVGKSTLANALFGSDRMLTGPEAGITRDAISLSMEWRGKRVILTDTAGLRKRARVDAGLEKISATDTMRALNFAQVVILVTDASNPLEKQDLLIARQVVEEGRALIIAINKWDTVANPAKVMNQISIILHDSLQQIKGVPIVTLSAIMGRGTDALMKAAFDIAVIWNKRVPTFKMNQWLKTMTEAHPPPVARNGRRIPMKYITQASTRPPTFVIFSSNPDELPESYLRYLSNGLRDDFGLKGVPIRIHMRKRENPYATNKKRH